MTPEDKAALQPVATRLSRLVAVTTTNLIHDATFKPAPNSRIDEAKKAKLDLKKIPKDEYGTLIKDLTAQMELAAANLQFEQAAELRDIIQDIKSKL